MGNRRINLFLLVCIAVCALLLWGVQRRVRFFPADSKARSVLIEEPLDALASLVVERGSTRMELRRKEGRWSMYAPFPAWVDQGAVARMLDAFENAKVTDAISYQELRRRELSLKEFGLASPAVRVSLVAASRRDEILVGAKTPLGSEVYVRLNDLDQIFVVPAELSRVLPKTADELRSRKLTHVERTLLRSIELRAPGRPFVKLSKETGTWRLVQPTVAPASDEKVESLLDALYDARVTRFVWPTVSNVMDVVEADSAIKARMELYGFGADSAVQIVLQESSPAVTAKILFGHPLDDSDTLRYTLLQGGETIGAVSNQVVKLFELSPSDLRDTRLFFDKPDRIRRLEVYFGDLLFVLTQTNSVWLMQAPVSDVADQRAVKDAVEQMLRLKAEKVMDESQEARRNNGELSPPISHVELTSEQSVQRFAIAPDDYAGTRYRVTFTNSPSVFLVASSNMPPALVSMIGLLGLRDKTVLSLSEGSIRRITVKRGSPGEADVLQRENGSAVWRLGEGKTGKVASERLAAWLACVASLKADRVEKLGLSLDDLDSYGLRSVWLEISVDVDAADAVRKTLLVGKEAGFGKRYAMVRGLDVLFVLDEGSLRELAAPLIEPL
jgi:hypothetical protein